ncbi:DNA-binding MarR family transcriptional regulator [Psychromicrobium silvestre]|uniref:DNA-binding MarR family transcriptional regulator n=1 Tax=Psychromicrobium silvestre TaxID=1645614 RepID=A0A7Y9S6Z7_9MICC|nr:MarR family transcriptional regulator [Psychromicrobium silvestre]NYE95748.1 DNA-binding MarR family transcriptional regulator [Psychromicrobium silvestre]
MSEPRWLSDQERRAWLALIFTFATLPHEFDVPLQRAAQLTMFDYNVLAMLSEQRERTLPMSELASRTNASLSRLSHVVQKLERRGLVRRDAHFEDGRVTTARITDEGVALVVRLAPEHVENVRSLVFDQLEPEEVQQLDRITRKLLRRLNPDQWIFQQDAVDFKEK